MKKKRFYIYLLICFFANALIFLVKLILEEPPVEVLKEAIMAFPVILIYFVLVYRLRKTVLKSVYYKKLCASKKLYKTFFWIVFVTSKIVVTAFILRIITLYFFDDDNSPVIGLALIAIAVGSSLAVFLVYLLEGFLESEKKRVTTLLNLKEYENEKAIANYNALKKQLNPHFLFNSFNSLAGLVSENSERSEEFVQELSNIYRYTLSKSEEMVVTLEEELQLINSYITLQQIRFKDYLLLHTTIDQKMLKLYLPPMTLELLVENAIKHNVIGKAHPLEIEMYTEDDQVIVKNKYIPKSSPAKSHSHGIGLKNLTNQYKLISSKVPSFGLVNGYYTAKVPLISSET